MSFAQKEDSEDIEKLKNDKPVEGKPKVVSLFFALPMSHHWPQTHTQSRSAGIKNMLFSDAPPFPSLHHSSF